MDLEELLDLVRHVPEREVHRSEGLEGVVVISFKNDVVAFEVSKNCTRSWILVNKLKPDEILL